MTAFSVNAGRTMPTTSPGRLRTSPSSSLLACLPLLQKDARLAQPLHRGGVRARFIRSPSSNLSAKPSAGTPSDATRAQHCKPSAPPFDISDLPAARIRSVSNPSTVASTISGRVVIASIMRRSAVLRGSGQKSGSASLANDIAISHRDPNVQTLHASTPICTSSGVSPANSATIPSMVCCTGWIAVS